MICHAFFENAPSGTSSPSKSTKPVATLLQPFIHHRNCGSTSILIMIDFNFSLFFNFQSFNCLKNENCVLFSFGFDLLLLTKREWICWLLHRNLQLCKVHNTRHHNDGCSHCLWKFQKHCCDERFNSTSQWRYLCSRRIPDSFHVSFTFWI